MKSETSLICKLGGFVNSNPEIISSYPNLNISLDKSKQLLYKCLPKGCKVGDFIVEGFIIVVQRSKNLLASIIIEGNNKVDVSVVSEDLKDLLDHLEHMCPELEQNQIARDKIDFLVQQYATNIL